MGLKQSTCPKCVERETQVFPYTTSSTSSKPILHKIILLGDSGVGKSSILDRYTKGVYREKDALSIAIDSDFKISGKYKYQIWDANGTEKFRTVNRSYYRGAETCIIVYDITSKESFLNVKRWVQELDTHANEFINIIIVGNKSDPKETINDDVPGRVVTTKEGQIAAEDYQAKFIEVSAKSGYNISKLFDEVVKSGIRNREHVGERGPG